MSFVADLRVFIYVFHYAIHGFHFISTSASRKWHSSGRPRMTYNLLLLGKLFHHFNTKKIKPNLRYTRLIPVRVSRVSGAQLRSFAPRPTHQGYSGGESLATCGRFIDLGFETQISSTRADVLLLVLSGRSILTHHSSN